MPSTPHHKHREQNERRQLLRTQHLIKVKWQKIPASQAALDPYDPALNLPPSLQLLQRLQELDAEQRYLLRAINSESRTIGQYLQLQDRKLHVLASSILPALTDNNAIALNISEGGISISASEPVAEHSWLHLVLQSQDGLLCLSTIGTVLQCSTHKQQITLNIQFTNLRDADRQSICRLVIRQGLVSSARVPHNTPNKEDVP